MKSRRIPATLLALIMLALLPLAGRAAVPTALHKGFVSAQELHELLQKKESGQQPPVVIEVGWGGPEDYYNKGHIPGAIHVNTDEIEYDLFKPRATTKPKELERSTTPEEDLAKGLGPNDTLPQNWWNVYPDKYLLPALAYMGVEINSTVVIYAKDPTAAARLAWAMLYAGVREVRLLDGGLTTWEKAGFEVTKTATPRTHLKSFGTDKALHPEYVVNIPFVRQAITTKMPHFILADIRTKKEYDGESAPYSYIPTKGRIKGARWGKAGKGPWTMDYYLNEDGTFREPNQIEMMWAENGITRDAHVAFYCGTAWRSSLAFYYAYLLGWEQISNFDSSWYEWSMGPEAAKNPVE